MATEMPLGAAPGAPAIAGCCWGVPWVCVCHVCMKSARTATQGMPGRNDCARAGFVQQLGAPCMMSPGCLAEQVLLTLAPCTLVARRLTLVLSPLRVLTADATFEHMHLCPAGEVVCLFE
jgi:hypothetical protein